MTKIDLKKPGLNVLFDYVSVTFPVDEREINYKNSVGHNIGALFANTYFKYFIDALNLDYRKFTDGGKIPHYDKLITYGEHIHFKYNGPLDAHNNMTHSLELKGEGCREAEKLGIDWYKIFVYIHKHNLNVSTLHIACDIFNTNFFTIEQLLKKSVNKEYTSWSRKFNYTQSHSGDTKTGTSLYFGRRDDNQINIYDKKNERYYKGYDVDTNIWYRIEIRLKTNKSWDFIRLLVNQGIDQLPRLYTNILGGMLDFKAKSNDSNKRRWKTWKPWLKFLDNSENTKLLNQALLESTLVKKREWLINSAGKAFLEFFSSINDLEKEKFLNEIIDRKLEKIDHKSLTRINEHRKNNGLSTFEDIDDLKNYMIETRLNLS